MKTTIAIFLLSLTLLTCKDKKDCCPSPADGIDQVWFDKTVNEIQNSSLRKYFYIVKAEYDGMCITYVNNCCPLCDVAFVIYFCDGTKLENFDISKIKNQTVVWTPDDFVCQL